jgi:exopolysaccharide production protein ExoQ
VRSTIDGFRASRGPGNAEKAFVVLVLLLALGAFMNLTITGAIETQNMGMLGMQILWSFLYIIMFVFYSRSCGRPLRNLCVVSPLLLVLGFVLSSALWSQDTWLTLRRSIALVLTLFFGVYFASRFKLREQFRLLACAFFVCVAFSFFFELAGLNPDEGIPGWYGVFALKVELGRNMALSVLVFSFWGKVEPEHRVLARVGFLASVALVLLSRDMTSVVVLVLSLILLPYLRLALRRSLFWATSGIGLLLVAGMFFVFYAAANLEKLTGLLGKDPMLTGRLPLWMLSTVMALQHPWLGYGFNAFWLPDETYTQRIWHLLHWMPPHAHNGLLELWLELGIVGTGLFLVVSAQYFTKAISFLRQSSDPAAAWPLIFFIFLFFGSITEATFLGSNSVTFILYVAVAATVSAKARSAPIESGLVAREQGYA